MHDAPSSSRRRIAGVAAALAALALAAPAVAQADSVAYIKSGNVFLATTDGSREYQVTFDGGYSTVSQADNGRMAALRGDHIVHLERDGRVIADIVTPVSTTQDPSMSFRGPFDPAISPDGKRVAYSYYWQYTGYGPGCQPPYCSLQRLYHGTAFTDPNRLTAWDEPGFKRRSGWKDPSWIDNDTVLLTDPYIQPNEDAILWSPSAADDSGLKRWFADHAFYGELKDSAMSRDKTAIATLVADGQKISIGNTVGGFYPDYPERCAMAQDDDPNTLLSSPTFAGDASKLFWAENTTGVHMATLPKFTTKGECPKFTDGGRLIAPGATNPDWGPADVPAPRQVPTPTNPGTPSKPGDGGAKGGGTTTETPTGTTVKLSVTKTKLAAALKRGLVLKLSGAANGKHTITAKFGKTTVAKGSVTVSGGEGKATLKFTSAGKKKLKGKRSAKLAISGAGTNATYTLKK
ncbi:hypothetical protein DVA67_023180 [Solirubrobacter sp. CPCC 204708]|uniref:Bacterial Ig-like domain-containing protein n=1 Tax=Solirubrobacter deserti TaxID=2282478 RepID=A0ABT4RIV6_9ACTN|nr:hypothetical protein [Solirubrobacter deserti]MBE2318895.1 hypothetical protein [Solirubrobacter deserti]MDA0138276.1 hypothetical protein [Solirubrobacter deserti]